jgi:hypothetical protein
MQPAPMLARAAIVKYRDYDEAAAEPIKGESRRPRIGLPLANQSGSQSVQQFCPRSQRYSCDGKASTLP